MPRTLAIDPRVPTSHGLVIRRHTLAEQTRAFTTIKEARAYARRIVKQAQLHAEDIKQEAIQQGFSEGWQDSLSVIYQTLRDTKQLHIQIDHQLKQAVHEAMKNALVQPDIELQLLEDWLAATPQAPSTLHLVLPRRTQAQVPAIIRRVEETLQVTPTITMGNSDCVIIECGDQIFEFSPTRMSQETDDLAKNCIRRMEIKKQYAEWSKHIVKEWLSNLAKRNDGALSEQSELAADDGVVDDEIKNEFEDEFEDDFDDDFDDDLDDEEEE
jgi:hypothetical protein